MPSWLAGLFLPALLAPPALSADQQGSLVDVPVAAKAVVPPVAYTEASALAAADGTPVDIALAIVGPFEGKTQHIIQTNDGSEAPSATQLTVIRDGLLDDAISAERWDIDFVRTPSGVWTINEVSKAWRCRRGEPRDEFATVRCP